MSGELKPEHVVEYLEYMLEQAQNPLYNQLEQGFRHSSLTQREIMDRYKNTCSDLARDIEYVLPVVRDMAEQCFRLKGLEK